MPQQKATSFADDLAAVGPQKSFADDLAEVERAPDFFGSVERTIHGMAAGAKDMVEHPVKNAPAWGGAIGGGFGSLLGPPGAIAGASIGAAGGSLFRNAVSDKPSERPYVEALHDAVDYGAFPEVLGVGVSKIPAMYRGAKSAVKRVGAKARNAEFTQATVNPEGRAGDISQFKAQLPQPPAPPRETGWPRYRGPEYDPRASTHVNAGIDQHVAPMLNPQGAYPPVAGTHIKSDITAAYKQRFGQLQSEYDQLLGTLQNPSPFGSATLPQPAPVPGAPPVPNPTIRQLHDMRHDALKQARNTADRQTKYELMQRADAYSNQIRAIGNALAPTNLRMAVDVPRYFDLSGRYAAETRLFDNPMMKTIMGTPDESVAALFAGGRKLTFKPTLGRMQGTLSQEEALTALEGILQPQTFARLQSSVGQRLIDSARDKTGALNVDKLLASLTTLQDRGKDSLVPRAARVQTDVAAKRAVAAASDKLTTPPPPVQVPIETPTQRLVRGVQNTSDSKIPGMVLSGKLPPTGSVRSLRTASQQGGQAMTNADALTHLESLVSPEAWAEVRAAAGKKLMEDATNASGISGPQLHSALRRARQQQTIGMINNADVVQKIADVLIKDRGSNAMTLPVKSEVFALVKKVIGLHHLDTPDLAYEITRLDRVDHRLARALVEAVTANTTRAMEVGPPSHPPLRVTAPSENVFSNPPRKQ